MTKPIILSWSGGKDSTMSLYTLKQSTEYEVVGLLTTITTAYDRISMHGVRRTLLDAQAEALKLPVYTVELSQQPSNEEYESKMAAMLQTFRQQGIDTVAFGDIFLEDLKAYRIQKMQEVGMRAIFPIWGRSSDALVREFIGLGFRAVITCVDSQQLDVSFAGRMIDETLLEDLPPHVDPCGENGEFHSFVFDGPLFTTPLHVETGERVLRDERFMFCD
ncbi:MAG: diphthine--ammonia ligase, partial [Chloroflexi bacterium]